MNRLLRILRHRWIDETAARRALDDAALARLAERRVQGRSDVALLPLPILVAC